MYQRNISDYVAREVAKEGQPFDSGKIKTKGTWFNIKHCTATPYLIQSRIHAALNDGEVLSPKGIPLDRFAIEIKRDKNSECFSIEGKEDYREWLDVVPVSVNSEKRKNIHVVCKDDGLMSNTLFGDLGDDLTFRKTRKATNCPDNAALVEEIVQDDIDLSWYSKQKDSEKSDCEEEMLEIFD